MANSDTDITVINEALSRFGGGEIQSLDEATDLAAICSRIYPTARDFLLCIHPWRFVMHKRQLALSAEEIPLNEWNKAYPLPADMLSGPWAVFGDGRQLPSHEYEIYNGHVYCDYTTVLVDYTRRVPEGEWPVWFKSLVVVDGASKLAVPVADQVSKAEALRLEAYGPPQMMGRGGLFAMCRRLDGQTQTTKTLFKNGDPLTSARLAGTSPKYEGEV